MQHPALPWILRFAVAAPLAALGGCGGGGTAETSPAPPPAATVSVLGCDANARVALGAGNGEALNNAWNVAAVGNFAWSQCLLEQRQGNSVNVGWTWRWPADGDQVYSYPSIVIGAKPWFGGPGNDARFPRRIADTPRLLLDYAVETSSTGNVNLATSMWFTRTTATPIPAADEEISTEIMVWSDYTPALVSSTGPLTERGRIDNLAGRSWRVFAADDWGDASGGTDHRWRFVVYVAEPTTRTLNMDLRPFIDDAIARRLLDPSHALANIELGNEISSGSGNTWVRRFSVTTP
jgi:hypothetical protein